MSEEKQKNILMPDKWAWEMHHGEITDDRKLIIFEKAQVLRATELEIYEPEVWAIDGVWDDETDIKTPGPKDIALTAACKKWRNEVKLKKATYRDRIESTYKLVETYKKLNAGIGDTFVRDAFIPWLEQAEACIDVDVGQIWTEVMK